MASPPLPLIALFVGLTLFAIKWGISCTARLSCRRSAWRSQRRCRRRLDRGRPAPACACLPNPALACRALPTWLRAVLWTAAILLPVLALWNATSYQFIWQSSRAVAAMLPVGMCWQLASNRVSSEHGARVLFASRRYWHGPRSTSSRSPPPIYFCYVAPLAVDRRSSSWQAQPALGMSAMAMPLLLPFALICMNRGYYSTWGVSLMSRDRRALMTAEGASCESARAKRCYHRLVHLILRPFGNGRWLPVRMP